MSETICLEDYVAYFEEPEPGVPTGCTGWYHSRGKFELRCPADAFAAAGTSPSLLKPGIAGPFHAKAQALADLQRILSN